MRAEATANSARFDAFEVDLDSGELRRAGVHIPLGEQPTQVLLALLRRPGSLVTREELRAALWPPNTFVEDADQGLNAAVKRLRDALDDHAEEPKFIETVPRRGYRFSGAIDARILPDDGPTQFVAEGGDPDARKTRRRTAGAIAIAGAVLTAAAWLAVRATHAPDAARLRVTAYRPLTEHSILFPPPHVKFPLLTDGPRLYFPEFTAGGYRARAVPAAGGVTMALDYRLGWAEVIEAVSPDGSELAVACGDRTDMPNSPLWSVPTTQGAARRIGTVESHGVTWLPDGRLIFLHGLGTDATVRIVNRDGSGERTLARYEGFAYWPRVSPDGRRVIVSWSNDQKMLEGEIAKGAMRPVAFTGVTFDETCCGNWTRDGRFFVFEGRRAGRTQLWGLREGLDKPTAPFQLTDGPTQYLRPQPSADGSTLYAVGWFLRGELARYDAAVRAFVPHPLGLSAQWLEYSRDRQWVAYVTYPEGDLWRARRDGTERLRLLTGRQIFNPHWSPDATSIALNVVVGNAWRVWRVSRNGGPPSDLTAGNQPSWSADGREIAFSREDGPAGSPTGIYVRTLATGEERRLPGPAHMAAPRWSPDGRLILAQVFADPGGLAAYDTQTQRWSTLVPSGIAYFPTWTTDSTSVYFMTGGRGLLFVDEIRRLHLRTRSVETVWRNRDFSLRPVWDPRPIIVPWFGLSDDDAPMLLRDLSTHDIYALDLAYDDK